MRVCTNCGHHNKLGATACNGCQREMSREDDTSLCDIAQDPTFLIGKVLNGKYEVLRVLGEGGMGVVYKVKHLILKNRNLFALKILHPKFSTDKGFQERFLREVEVAMDLTHENIVQIRDFGITEHELLFFTMDFFPGETLKTVLRREKAFAPSRVSRIANSVLSALGEAHKSGVVHRDLKPDNILVSTHRNGDEVRILDFGIAKLLEGSATESNTLTHGDVIGTPKYMSPEQASGDAVDERSDFYSLGVVLYELLMGKAPFVGKTMRQIVMGHLSTPPAPFCKVRPELKVPQKLERFVMQLLEKDPRKRPASAGECIDELHDTGTLSMPASSIAAARRRKEKARARRRSLAAVVIFAFSLAAISALLVFERTGGFGSAEAKSSSMTSSKVVAPQPTTGSPATGSPAIGSPASGSPASGSPATGTVVDDQRTEAHVSESASPPSQESSASGEQEPRRVAPRALKRAPRRCLSCGRRYPPQTRRKRCPSSACNGPLIPIRR